MPTPSAAPPTAPSTAGGPLSGVRVLDLCTVGPGPRASGLLADLGADVVRIGPPAAANRIVAPAWAYGAGRGCRRIEIDLKDADGSAALLALAGVADVVLEGFRPGVADRLGIGFTDVRAVNPAVVYASLTGYGQHGPWSGWAGHDLNYQAVGGALALQGRDEGGGPALPGATWADAAGGGMQAALAICAQLVGDRSLRVAVHLDVAATDGVLAVTSLAVDQALAGGDAPRVGGGVLTGGRACYATYRCADDRFLAVGAIEPEFWRNLCQLLDLADLADLQHVDDAQPRIRRELAGRFATRPRDEWVDLLGPRDTCVSPVLEVDEVADNEHLAARDVVSTVALPDGEARQVARMVAGSVRPPVERGCPPGATDAATLLAEAGWDDDRVSGVMARGVVR